MKYKYSVYGFFGYLFHDLLVTIGNGNFFQLLDFLAFTMKTKFCGKDVLVLAPPWPDFLPGSKNEVEKC